MFYHRTTEEAWELIQKEGVLWGVGDYSHRYRYTYLAPFDWGDSYGPVLLKVNYIPCGRCGIDNYAFCRPLGTICTQFSVFIPISVSMTERIESASSMEKLTESLKATVNRLTINLPSTRHILKKPSH